MTPVSAKTMRELDRLDAESGISALFLMENAGVAVSRKTADLLGGSKIKEVVISHNQDLSVAYVAGP